MQKHFTALLLALAAHFLSAQTVTDKVFVVSGGLFETTPPFADFTKVHVYQPLTQNLVEVDQIGSQSTQGALMDGNALYVFTNDSIVKYDARTQLRVVVAKYPGISPRPQTFAVNDSLLAVANWYGHDDSGVYVFDKQTLQLKEVVAAASKEVTALAFSGASLLMGQNIKGTVDGCPPWGCYADSIGEYGIYNINTHNYNGPITLNETEGGINSFFLKGDSVIHANSSASSVSVWYNGNTTTHQLTGDVGRGIKLVGNTFYFLLNGKVASFDLSSNTVTGTNLSAIDYPAAIVFDELNSRVYETSTDYFSFGKTYISQLQLIDSFDVGISPEGLALHRINNEAPVALNDTVSIHYTNDTVVQVTMNDVDSTLVPLTVSILQQPLVPGSTAFVVNENEILYLPAAGIETSDSLWYLVCDQAGLCDTAVMVLLISGNTPIDELEKVQVVLAPNPTFGTVGVYSDANILHLKVSDATGVLVEQQDGRNSNQAMLSLPVGIYFVQVTTEAGSAVCKVISLR